MIFILVDPSYVNSNWCHQLMDGLVNELKNKRYEFKQIPSMKDLTGKASYVYIIGTTTQWIQAVLEESCRVGIYPILLCNHSFQKFHLNYSMVSSDINGSMQHLVRLLREMGRKRIALYGVNPRSASDDYRKSSFLLAYGQEDSCIYCNERSLSQCFQDFLPKAEAYDAVVCANDFAAISLVRNLHKDRPEALERLFIIGCAETRLTDYYSSYIVSLRVNFAEYGRAAVTIMDTLRRNPHLSNILINVRWDFTPLSDHPDFMAVPVSDISEAAVPELGDTFYEDEELREMLRVEQLLNECDQLDHMVLQHLINGDSYETIADICFINVSTVKYRIRKMAAISQTSGRRELTALVKKYVTSFC